jgi:hypothetical protein
VLNQHSIEASFSVGAIEAIDKRKGEQASNDLAPLLSTALFAPPTQAKAAPDLN